jgi:glutamyl-tRNA synthetase
VEFFLVDSPTLDPKAADKWLTQPHAADLFAFIAANPATGSFEEATAHYDALLRKYAVDNSFEKLGPIVHPTRVKLTGKTTGPGLFELMAVLGPDRLRERLLA